MVSPALLAQLTIALFAMIAAALIFRDVSRWGIGWRIWFLYFLNRTYGAFFFHPRFNRRCPLPEEAGGLIIANHRSPVDPLVIWMNHHLAGRSGRIRNFRFMMAKEYLDVRGVGWVTRSVSVIATARDGRDMGPAKEALRALKNGELVCLFPEGRLNRGVDLLEGNPGVAWLALRAKVPVYPIYVQNSPQDGSMVDAFCRFSRINIFYGEPIDLSEYHKEKKTQELLRTVTDHLMSQLAKLGNVNATPIAVTKDVVPESPTTENSAAEPVVTQS